MPRQIACAPAASDRVVLDVRRPSERGGKPRDARQFSAFGGVLQGGSLREQVCKSAPPGASKFVPSSRRRGELSGLGACIALARSAEAIARPARECARPGAPPNNEASGDRRSRAALELELVRVPEVATVRNQIGFRAKSAGENSALPPPARRSLHRWCSGNKASG
jgi:hypothetical protein